jgi:hypothetical protein
MATHPQNSPRGLFIKQLIQITNSTGSLALTPVSGGGLKLANSTGNIQLTPVSGGLKVASSTGNVTFTPTSGGGVSLGVSNWALTAKSTGIIIGALLKYLNVNSTGIRIGTKYVFTTSVAGGGQ